MDLGLTGKNVLITGPTKGLGAAIRLAFGPEGCDLVLAGRDVATIAPVAEAARGMGRPVAVMACDLTDMARCQAVADEAAALFGGIDVLVNVAGGAGPMGNTGWETTRAEFDEIVTLNMAGCFNTMRALLPGMIARRQGRIVNVGGTFGMRGRAGRMAYSASNRGLRGITKSMALEAGPHGINVNLPQPGFAQQQQAHHLAETEGDDGQVVAIEPDGQQPQPQHFAEPGAQSRRPEHRRRPSAMGREQRRRVGAHHEEAYDAAAVMPGRRDKRPARDDRRLRRRSCRRRAAVLRPAHGPGHTTNPRSSCRASPARRRSRRDATPGRRR